MKVHSLAELATGKPIDQWVVLGPFVIRTSPHFEREYIYERARILDVDYLEANGGEARVQPGVGQAHPNPGIGPTTLAWRPYEGNDLHGMRIAGDAIYETVQRNCVIYAAARIDAHADGLALLTAEHSGMKAWMNGELVCNEPYGRTKGVRITMQPKPVRLRHGERDVVGHRPLLDGRGSRDRAFG